MLNPLTTRDLARATPEFPGAFSGFEQNVRVEKINHMRSKYRHIISFFSTLLFQLDKLKDQFITTKGRRPL